jgi:ACS family glucarate transporter-like MFS transporter
LPGGVFGQRLGARATFVIIGVAAVAAMIATPLAPVVFAGSGLFIALLCAQLMLGVSQAALFPVGAGVFETWFPPQRWALVQGLQTMGLGLGAAVTPPLIASLMNAVGWQRAIIWTTLPALGLTALWAWYGRNTPREHPSVSTAELAELGEARASEVDSHIGVGQLLRLLTNRNVVLLTLSYLTMNYAFYLLSNWCFLYLVQERHFSLLEGGWLASAPPLAAAIGAGIGGGLTSVLCVRYGLTWGFRLIPLTALPAAGLLLWAAVGAANPLWAVVALAVCFGLVELTEGAYWGGAMTLGRSDSMALSGIMNTGGNLGGVIGIPIIAYLSGHNAWHAAFLIGSGCALASAVAWLGIDARQPVDAS